MLAIKRYINTFREPIRVYWWRYQYPDKLNFGDELTPILIQQLFGYRCEWARPSECQLAGAGSIIEIMQRDSMENQCFIWGSGFIKPGEVNHKSNLIFTAVRGEHTLGRINNVDVPLGDPGLLVSKVFRRSRRTSDKIALLAHYADADLPIVKRAGRDSRFTLIDPLDDPKTVAREISECKLVLSSSLHGLIFSDSYSVPNAWVHLSNNLTGGRYKFEDYYSATDRKIYEADKARIFDHQYLEQLIAGYKPIIRLAETQDALVKAFPFS